MSVGKSQTNADGRQSLRALQVQRGVGRLLHNLNFAVVSEMVLPNGRRADIVALGPKGEIWIIEIKSSVADFRADEKWQTYLAFCDRFYFATLADVPESIFPETIGLAVADEFGGAFVRETEDVRLKPAMRRAMTLSFGRIAAQRLNGLDDPFQSEKAVT